MTPRLDTPRQKISAGRSAFGLARPSAALMFVLLVVSSLLAPAASRAAAPLLANGGLDEAGEDRPFAGWTAYVWEGFGRTEAVEAGGKGGRGAMIENNGTGKQALYQETPLPACRYRLSALLAASDLRPNEWKQGAALYVSFEKREQIFRDVLTGDSDWRRVELEFGLTSDDKATVYFFNYGSGRLFVDDVSLQQVKGCKGKTSAETLTIAERPARKLVYDPPLEPADLALAGYCSHSRLARAPFCRRLAAKTGELPQRNQAAAPLTLADFASKQPFAEEGWSAAKLADGTSAAQLTAGQYMSARSDTGLPSDWSGYDWLTFAVDNPADKPQKLAIELHDDKSHDYWSRVNYEVFVSPGHSRLRIPLQVFVGEKSVIRERRRLDLTQVRNLVFLASEATDDLTLSQLALEPEAPYANDFAQLVKLDAGPPTAPLMYGFTPLSADTAYRPERGFGFSADAVLPQVQDRRHPDDLFRDWISITRGGLDFDLPDGRYQVWMMLEDPGYWEYFPSYEERSVSAEGRTVLNGRMNAKGFLANYFRHDDDEDLPGDDIWQRYVPTRYRPLQFAVDVRDGQLNLRFEGHDNPYALALSALIIYPDAEKQKGEAFIGELWQRLKQHYDHEYLQIVPAANEGVEPAGNALAGRLTLFHRSPASDIGAFERPKEGEAVDRLALSLARGETAPLTLTLRPHADLRLTGAKLELPGLAVTTFKVRYKISRVTQDGTVYASKPLLLDPLDVSPNHPLALTANVNRRLWFDVEAPGEFKAAKVDGRLRLEFADAPAVELPVTVDVHPWRLPESDIAYGYLGIVPTYPSTPWPEIGDQARKGMAEAVKQLAEHGMNRFSGGLGGPVFKGYENGKLQMDFTRADETMQILRQTGKGVVESYMGLGIEGLAKNRPDEDAAATAGKPFGRVLKDVIGAIRSHGKEQGWRDIGFEVGDEPAGDDIAQSVALAKAFKAADKRVSTSVFTSATGAGAPELVLAGPVGQIYLNHHNEEAIRLVKKRGSGCALYNQNDRYRRGIYQFRLRELGCAGHMQFAFSSVHVDPWYDLDGREADYVAAYAHRDGRLRPAVKLKRYRAAIDDYRYLLKLEQSVKGCAGGEACDAARAWLQDLTGKMDVGSDRKAPWSDEEIDGIRAAAARHIDRLEAAPK